MQFVIGLLTAVLVLNCLVLGFLILLQLPKKEAGMGTAFGGGATDLFGAGTGDVLTKATKYSAGIFIGLSLILSVMTSHLTHNPKAVLDQELARRASTGTLPLPPTTPPANAAMQPAGTNALAGTNSLLLATPAVSTNAAKAPAVPPALNSATPTNAAGKK